MIDNEFKHLNKNGMNLSIYCSIFPSIASAKEIKLSSNWVYAKIVLFSKIAFNYSTISLSKFINISAGVLSKILPMQVAEII